MQLEESAVFTILKKTILHCTLVNGQPSLWVNLELKIYLLSSFLALLSFDSMQNTSEIPEWVGDRCNVILIKNDRLPTLQEMKLEIT